MTNKKLNLRIFLSVPAAYGLLSTILLIVALALDRNDPNSPSAYGLLLGILVANFPGVKTIGMFYVNDQLDSSVTTFLFFVGGIVITNLYLGCLLFLGSSVWRKIQISLKGKNS